MTSCTLLCNYETGLTYSTRDLWNLHYENFLGTGCQPLKEDELPVGKLQSVRETSVDEYVLDCA